MKWNEATGHSPKDKEMEPDKHCDVHSLYYAPNEGCEKCIAELRAVWDRAYFAALGGICAISDGPATWLDLTEYCARTADATVKSWPFNRDQLIKDILE